MSTFLQNWMNLRAMSAPRGGEEKMWERVQYILPAGTSRNGIDLGISPTANMNVEMHLIDFDPWVQYGNGTCNLLITNKATSTSQFNIWAFNNGAAAYARCAYGDASGLDCSFLWGEYNFGHETILERRGASVYLDGVLQATSPGTFTTDNTVTLVIGDSPADGEGTYNAKYAEVIVRSEYGSTILGHFIPVKILQSGPIDQLGRTIAVGAGCYYDLVTKQFYAATYGSDFVAGPAVPTEYINFVDPAVEAICVANFSSDGIGVTMADAAAVTSQQFKGKFKNNTSIVSFEEFQYFTGVDRLSDDDGFYGCSNLQALILPSSSLSLGWGTLACPSLIGTFVLPSTAINDASRSLLNGTVGLTNLVCLMPSTQTLFMESGNGSGILYTKEFNAVNRYIAAHYKHIVVDGDMTFSIIDWCFEAAEIKSIRIKGNYSASNQGYIFRSPNTPLEFLEINGTVSGVNWLVNGFKSGAILHLGYNGIAVSASVANMDTNLATIYVGSGESQAADQAVLNQYLADPDWAQYSSKLDLWYNYNGPYKNWPTIPTA